jgi:hypothetical protein
MPVESFMHVVVAADWECRHPLKREDSEERLRVAPARLGAASRSISPSGSSFCLRATSRAQHLPPK